MLDKANMMSTIHKFQDVESTADFPDFVYYT